METQGSRSKKLANFDLNAEYDKLRNTLEAFGRINALLGSIGATRHKVSDRQRSAKAVSEAFNTAATAIKTAFGELRNYQVNDSRIVLAERVVTQGAAAADAVSKAILVEAANDVNKLEAIAAEVDALTRKVQEWRREVIDHVADTEMLLEREWRKKSKVKKAVLEPNRARGTSDGTPDINLPFDPPYEGHDKPVVKPSKVTDSAVQAVEREILEKERTNQQREALTPLLEKNK